MDEIGGGWHTVPRPGQSHTCRPLQEDDSRSPRNWSDGFTTEIKAECGGLCVMECKRCKANLTWRAAYPRRTGSPRGQVGCLQRLDTSTEEGRGQRLQEPTLKQLPPRSAIRVHVGSHQL